MADYYILNTNKANLPDDGTKIYDRGVAATYGDKEQYGNLLRPIDAGDVILSYVNGDGFRAVGKVTQEWDGNAVPEDEQLYEKNDAEYHLEVRWQHVLNENEAIPVDEAKQILGYGPDMPMAFTCKHVRDSKAGKRLADAIRGNEDWNRRYGSSRRDGTATTSRGPSARQSTSPPSECTRISNSIQMETASQSGGVLAVKTAEMV